MNIIVLLKMVPDVVEELEVAADGKSLDTTFLRTIINERDDHALEQALLLKERHGGKVTVVALDAPDIDDTLFATLAKGADRVVKITDVPEGMTTQRAAKVCAKVLASIMPADLVLTGVQALDDLDALCAAVVAHELGLPYVGVVTAVSAGGATATVVKEFASGVRGEFVVSLPAVLGIQAAEKPPRYVPVAKVRAVMKTAQIETVPAPCEIAATQIEVRQLAKPVVTGHAEMLEGSPEEVAAQLVERLAQRGLI
ncbi:MAG: electron transfer flavoprotein subunit beta/FixA family protein [Verrucomicrobiae bacterium]|nr:electron transfer flavoprotein subunit beta/FixA family protein [Verrucomicrobiae bacterium]